MYDFKNIVNRTAQGGSKWVNMKHEYPETPNYIVPLSIADMDFKHPDEFIEPFVDFIKNEAVLGYTKPTPAYYDSVMGWMKRRHDWDVKQEWIIQASGIVYTLYNSIKAFTEPGDGVLIISPVYFPFKTSIVNSERVCVESDLVLNNGRYEIDFEDFEEKAKDPNNKMLIFCSPHNPVMRVWTKEELERIVQICVENDVLIVSDEAHHDLIMPGHEHHVIATISEEAKNNVIVCTSIGKPFNMAGMHAANIFIPNPEVRSKYQDYLVKIGDTRMNALGQKAIEISYNTMGDWLDELIEVIHKNYITVKNFFKEKLPGCRVYDMEGTYLLWVDMSSLQLTHEEMVKFMEEDCQLFLNYGEVFGEAGQGHVRFNIATSEQVIAMSLERLESGLKQRGFI